MAECAPPVSDPDRSDRLDGWKAIAAHLGRSVRTVQRWELTENLPVHRHPHQKLSSAWAYRGELDRWVDRRSDLAPEPVTALRRTNTAPPSDIVGDTTPFSPAPSASYRVGRWMSLLGLSLALATTLLIGQHQDFRSRTAVAAIADGRDTRDPLAREAFVTGRTAYIDRRYADALDATQRAIGRDSAYASAWILLAKIHGRLASAGLSRSEAQEPAVAAAARAIALAPSSAEAHVAQALAARARRDVTAWRGHARQAIEIDPESAEAHAVLADSYSGQLGFACGRDRNPELADAHYQTALELDAGLHTARVNRAQNLAYLGRYEACATVLTPFIDATGDRNALAVRARCSLMGNDLDAADRDIQRLTRTPGPASSAVLLDRGWLRMKRGELTPGARDLESAADLNKSFPMELNVAQAYADVGQPSRAAEHLERAFAIDASCAKTVAAAPSFRIVRRAPEVSAALASYGVR
jgi:tetratricopeptide (TPR) repeat protein